MNDMSRNNLNVNSLNYKIKKLHISSILQRALSIFSIQLFKLSKSIYNRKCFPSQDYGQLN